MKRNFNVDIDQGAHSRLVILSYAINEAWGINSQDIHTNVVHKAYIECLEKLDDLKTKESTSLLLRDRHSDKTRTLKKSSFRIRSATFTPDRDLVATHSPAASASVMNSGPGLTPDEVKRNTVPQVVVNRLNNVCIVIVDIYLCTTSCMHIVHVSIL